MLEFFKNYKEKQERQDLADRKAYLVKTTFNTITGIQENFYEWVRLDNYRSGIAGYKKLLMRKSTLTVEKITYNTSHIVTMESEVVDEGFIRKDVKKKMGGYRGTSFTAWDMAESFSAEDIE